MTLTHVFNQPHQQVDGDQFNAAGSMNFFGAMPSDLVFLAQVNEAGLDLGDLQGAGAASSWNPNPGFPGGGHHGHHHHAHHSTYSCSNTSHL